MSGFVGNVIKKDPDAVLTYGVAWKDWLNGRTLASAAWIVPDGLTKGAESVNATPMTDDNGVSHPANTVATVSLSGGTHGQSYTVTCRITTTDGEVDDRSIVIVCANR